MIAIDCDGFRYLIFIFLLLSADSTLKHMLMDCVWPFFPEEIIANIVKRLPVKSLMRFQCVSKCWKNLIKSPSFIEEHLRNSTRRSPSLLIEQVHRYDPYCLCLLDSKMQLREVESPPLFNSLRHVCIVGSSNGLLCLADRRVIPPAPLLWNPATKEVKKVPATFHDLSVSWHFGFGFSPFVNDYKIVRINSLGGWFVGSYVVEVYSLSTRSWRKIQYDSIKGVRILRHGVTVNGVIFWTGYSLGVDAIDNHGTDVIISFDIASEVFTVTPLPLSLILPGVKHEPTVYKDKLTIISEPVIINAEYSYIYFGVMEEDGVMGTSGEICLSRNYIHDFDPFNVHDLTIWSKWIVCIDFEFELPKSIGETGGEKENAEQKLRLYLINVYFNEGKLFAIPKPPDYLVNVFNYVESLVPIGNS